MLQGWPKLKRRRGNLDGYPVRQNSNGNLAGWPNRGTPTRLDTTDSLAIGLVGWWPMNEGNGTIIRDWSLYANHGAMASMGATRPSGWGVNDGLRWSGGLWFDGTNDYVSVPHIAALALTGDVTMVQFHNCNNFSGGWEPIRKGVGSYPQPIALAIEGGTGKVYCVRGNGSSQRYGLTANAEIAGQWNCAIVANSGSAFTMWLNGVKTTGTDGSGSIADSGGPLAIGSRATSCCWLPGGIAHTRLYNRVLTDAEAARIYADPWAGAV